MVAKRMNTKIMKMATFTNSGSAEIRDSSSVFTPIRLARDGYLPGRTLMHFSGLNTQRMALSQR